MQNSEEGLSPSARESLQARLQMQRQELERQLESQPHDKPLENRLRDTNAALKRLEVGTYGVCFDCAKPIPFPTLDTDPLAIRDVECQRAYEAVGRGQAARPASRQT
jgi:RNA polymerase-binding transcription factor DksA